MPGLFFYVANNLDLEVELANPWKSVVIPPKLESKRESLLAEGPVYTTCVGLGLKEI